jgi:uncharacterized protein YggE
MHGRSALLASLLIAAPAWAQQPPTVKVTAEATVSGQPDVTDLALGVVSEAKTAEAAAAENARRMERLVAALKKEVPPSGEVSTVNYAVEQRFGPPKNDVPTITGYVVTNTVHVRMPGTGGAGKLVDLALKQGANDVQRLSFSIRDPEPLRARALHDATLKARRRAEAMAGALGLHLAAVVSATEGEGREPPLPIQFAEKAAMVARTPIQVGAMEVGTSVTVVFSTAPGTTGGAER